jgi:hypothetical protein
MCPVELVPLTDAVVTGDGHSYNRAPIERWLATSHKSPLTNRPLADRTLTPNLALRRIARIVDGI